MAEVRSRRGVALLDRVELEDKYIEITEENQLLKKHAKAQEEKMRRMATKLLRLTADDKRGLSIRKGGEGMEELVTEFQERVRELEKQNANLKGRVTILKQQLDTRGKRHTQYDHVPSKINSGLSKTANKSFSTEDISTIKRKNVSMQVSPAQSRYGHSLLEEARKDNEELEELVLSLKEEISLLKCELDQMKEEGKIKQLKHEEEVLQLKDKIQSLLTATQKMDLEEDVEKIKLQRELRIKSTHIQTMETQHITLEKNLESLKSTRENLMEEIEVLNTQLKHEQNRTAELRNELHSKMMNEREITELQQIVSDLRSEKDLLKQSNERLMKSALRPVSENESTSNIRILQDRVKELEDKVRNEMKEKRNALDRLNNERELNSSLQKELTESKEEYTILKTEHRSVLQRLTHGKGSTVNWKEVEEALSLHKLNKVKNEEPLQLIQPVTLTECTGECKYEIQELRIALAETTGELNKSRKLLALQNTISRDCKKELDTVRIESEQMRMDYEKRLQESAQLLDIRSARVKKLESQLKDIKYDPRSSKVKIESPIGNGLNKSSTIIELEMGQNLLQIYIGQLRLTKEALTSLSSSSSSSLTPSLFLSLTLSGYETQVTQVIHSAHPVYDFTANYIINADNEFLEQINMGSLLIELYQAFGMEYQILGSVSMFLKPLASSAAGEKVHDRLALAGTDKLATLSKVGTLDCWMKLKLPITQSTHLFQERSEHRPFNSSPQATDTTCTNNNELIINIIRCTDLPMSTQGQPPSAYVMYKFYEYPDHDTPISQPTTSPDFNNIQHYEVIMGSSLHSYLKEDDLEAYVFNDEDSVDDNYIGMTSIPLIQLSNGHEIEGTFPLFSALGDSSGHIVLKIFWKSPYHVDQSLYSSTFSRKGLTATNETLAGVNNVRFPSPLEKRQLSDIPSLSNSLVLTDKDASLSSNIPTNEPVATPLSELQNITNRPVTKPLVESKKHVIEPLTKPLDKPQKHTIGPVTKPLDEPQKHGNEDDVPPIVSVNVPLNPVSVKPLNGLVDTVESVKPKLPHGDEDDSLSLTELSEEEIDEELEEEDELTTVTEDTLFEETLKSKGSPVLSSSKPSVMLMKGDEIDEESLLGDSLDLISDNEDEEEEEKVEENEGDKKTDILVETSLSGGIEKKGINSEEAVFSLTILSFTVEEGSSLTTDPSISQIFVEYQFLDYDESELETPFSLPLLPPGQPAVFNFRKEFNINQDTHITASSLLMAMINSTNDNEKRIPITLVSDPTEENDTECQELGVAKLDLQEVLSKGTDHVIEDVDVHSLENEEVIGYLTIVIEGLDSLRQMQNS